MARPNKIWFYKATGWWCVIIEGKRIRLAEGRENRKAAERRFHELKLAGTQTPEAPSARVADVIEAFLDWAKIHLSDETNRNLVWYAQGFSERSGDLRVTELKPIHLTRWVDKKNWNDTTERNARRAIYRAFSWACSEGIIGANPLVGMRCPRAKTRERVMTDDEFRLILRESKRDFKMLMFTLRETGCRPKEARTLTWDCVQEDRWVLPEHKTAYKTGRPRVVFLTVPMRKLMTLLRRTSKAKHVFVTARGKPWSVNVMRLRLARIKRNTDLPNDCCPYLLRHAWGTQAVINGVDVLSVAQLMGHRDLTMIQRVYVHLAEKHEHLQQAMERARRPAPPKPSLDAKRPSA